MTERTIAVAASVQEAATSATYVQKAKGYVDPDLFWDSLLAFDLHKKPELNLQILVPVGLRDQQVLARQEAFELVLELETYINECTDVEIANFNHEISIESVMSQLGYSRDKAIKYLQNDSKKVEIKHSENTLNGYVYLIHAVGTSRYKIGLTTGVSRRFADLKKQSPFPLSLIHSFASTDCFNDEALLHGRYKSKRVHGEWFELTEQDVLDICAISEVNL